MKNLNLHTIIEKLGPALNVAQKYSRFIFFMFLTSMCAFLIYQINVFASVTPSEDAVSAKLQTVTRPHIDQTAVDKIQNMQEQNVQVQSLIENARNNPFSE